jgi:myo-inositol 2-dehydrogenase/D-chiro-inositol 1-dehydrogenase
MAERVRVGVIGAGALGYEHCRSLAQRIPEADLAAVADLNLETAQRAAGLAPDASATGDYRSILSDTSIRAVVVATPNDTHAQLAGEAAEAGKHVFCEKPLGLDLESVDAALASAVRHNVMVQVGFQRRFDRAYREARRMIAEGEVGSVELVVGTTRDPGPPSPEYLASCGGFFADTAIHDLDSIRFLTGLEVSEVFAAASTLILPEAGEASLDTAVTTLRLENGALAVITNSRRATYGYEVGIEVLGSKGKVAVAQEQQTLLRGYADGGVSHDYVGSYWERFGEAFVREMEHFVECVAEGRRPEASGEDGRAALELALLAARSYREGRPLLLGGEA